MHYLKPKLSSTSIQMLCRILFLILTLCCRRLSAAMKEASGCTPRHFFVAAIQANMAFLLMPFAADKKQALKKMQVSMRSHCPANNRPLLPAAVHGADARPGHRCHVSICNQNVLIFFVPKADVDGANILGNRGWRTRYEEVNSGQGELHILKGSVAFY